MTALTEFKQTNKYEMSFHMVNINHFMKKKKRSSAFLFKFKGTDFSFKVLSQFVSIILRELSNETQSNMCI